ncbi:HAEPLYID family protein [Spirosoma sp. KUDC1026]|uniref:HAEPLYID family protein n=1 Tax=Spirosoma sp. KUDC1026 TaxID=2745947 RepID=UPI00159B9D7F|nr:HAEPLYID family protein [Spirosoma sp. KUDC1026]QKZ13407.1 phosphoribosylformylglycinamidine synthase [Spirosoma sp. KUDC1026]
MKKASIYWICILCISYLTGWGQSTTNPLPTAADTVPSSVGTSSKATKISHAEPLYLDLVRDLGARKGEREWNVGTEFSRQGGMTSWHPFVEYEFAPINRLGLEVEVPFQLLVPTSSQELPTTTFRVHSIKTSVQWTYAVIRPWQTSLAIGYTNELVVNSGGIHAGKAIFTTEEGHPFLVAAKKWGRHWNSLVYAALGGQLPMHGAIRSDGYELNLALHYVIPQYKAFVGVELYQYRNGPLQEQTVRPQVRIALKNNLLLGLVSSLPVNGTGTASSFLRLIYEPRRR